MNDLNKNMQTKEVNETGPGNKNVILYTIHCKHCKELETKLKNAGVKYEECTDIDVMRIKKFKSAPMLEVDGKIYDFAQALKWLAEGAN